jgi:hypothetical protein
MFCSKGFDLCPEKNMAWSPPDKYRHTLYSMISIFQKGYFRAHLDVHA